MKILFNNVKNLLSEKLSVSQRGLLITLLLCKDITEKITLAKFKAFVNLTEYREDLIFLHKNNFIKWSGYNRALKEVEKINFNPNVNEAITFMNNLYDRDFDPSKESSTSQLRIRLKENSLDDVKLVISNRYEEWKDDKTMSKFLQPSTIFRKKHFEKYLEEAKRTSVGKGILSANKIDLNDGDELTYTNVKSLPENDVFTIKTYRTNEVGRRVGNGKTEKHLGKTLKKLLNIQNNLEKSDSIREFCYIFVKK